MAFPNKSNAIENNDLLSYYLSINMNNICRVCLEKSNRLTPIFDPVKPPHFSVLIMACASVEVQEGDGLPPYICQRCISRLNIAFQFKTQCEASDVKLKQCFEQYSLQQTGNLTEDMAIKNEVEKELLREQNEEALQYLDSGQTVFHCQDTNARDLNMIQVHNQAIISNENQEEEFKVGLQSNYIKDNNTTIKLDDLAFQSQTSIATTERRKEKKAPKVHQCDTCSKIFKTKPSLVHHIRIHTGERPYVCHLCHKRFVNGGHLHTHMKTHTGEKSHICAACNKGFTTAQQLTKHTIAIHTSERPYGCTYCPKRFASSSNLNTHIKIHTGEKNFHCEICGKTFSTKGQLHQHLLVHTGEKAFLCEYCNKRFSQKAHLVRHLRTHIKAE